MQDSNLNQKAYKIIHLELKHIIRFLSKINHTGNCWEWKGTIDRKGYGVFHLDQKKLRAHRVSYEIFKGVIKDNLPLDHLCRNRLCVNPDHLEPVTLKENIHRGQGICGVNYGKTHCKRGHILEGDNLVKSRLPDRCCRTCFNEYMKLKMEVHRLKHRNDPDYIVRRRKSNHNYRLRKKQRNNKEHIITGTNSL